MTREEEIKARLDDAKFNGPMCSPCEQDVRYLLARNEELQRRVEKMQALGRSLYLTSRKHPDWPGCRIVDAEKLKPFQPEWVGSEDAKEQQNDQAD